MVPIATILGPNCKKMECNWATMQPKETWGVKVQFQNLFHACIRKELKILQLKGMNSADFLFQACGNVQMQFYPFTMETKLSTKPTTSWWD